MKNITILLPIHILNDYYRELIDNGIKSVEPFYNDVKLKIICPKEISEVITSISDKLEIKILTNNGETDFCSQINKGIDECDTEWFSILEVDDEYYSAWIKSMNEYMREYTDVDVFLPVRKRCEC